MKQFNAGYNEGFEAYLWHGHTSEFVVWGATQVNRIFIKPYRQAPFLKEIYEE